MGQKNLLSTDAVGQKNLLSTEESSGPEEFAIYCREQWARQIAYLLTKSLLSTEDSSAPEEVAIYQGKNSPN